eukprot:CFRG1626T1
MVWPFETSFEEYDNKQKYFVNAEGLSIFYQVYEPVGNTKANVFICHGLAEHIESKQWTKNVIPAFTKQGYRVMLMDHQGHGRSMGHTTAYAHGVDFFVADFKQFVSHMQERIGDDNFLPKFIVGHSLGGLIAFEVVRTQPETFKGAIINGGAFYINPELATPILKTLSGICSSLLPQMPLPEKLDLRELSRDPAVYEECLADPLRFKGGVRARVAKSVLDKIDFLQTGMAEFKTPVLFMHGECDKICSPDGTKQFYNGVASDDKTLKIFDGMLHETFNDPETYLVTDLMTKFIDERL